VIISLLCLGVAHSRVRTLNVISIFIMPIVMTSISLLGIIVFFGAVPLYLAVWSAGLMSCLLVVNYAVPREVNIEPTDQSITVAGSWLPITLMVVIFILKYQMYSMVLNQDEMIESLRFIIGVCLLYGLFCGVFIARCLGLLRAIKQVRAND